MTINSEPVAVTLVIQSGNQLTDLNTLFNGVLLSDIQISSAGSVWLERSILGKVSSIQSNTLLYFCILSCLNLYEISMKIQHFDILTPMAFSIYQRQQQDYYHHAYTIIPISPSHDHEIQHPFPSFYTVAPGIPQILITPLTVCVKPAS